MTDRSPRVAQLALCSADLPQTLRLYSEVFGFADAGGRRFWGEWLARVQGLGDDAACLLWWMVGRQDLVQLEFFHHTLPRQRPLREDWRPCDHGWVRWGLAVPDFDAALARLEAFGVATLTAPVEHEGLRRVCFSDPGTGIVVEVLEEGAATPGAVRPRHLDLVPAVVYAAVSVADLERARAFFVGTLGLSEEDPDTVHPAALESLWGLDGARREQFVVRGGDVYLEVVRYDDPAPRRPPDDARLSDQGFMNVAVGFRDRRSADALLARVSDRGYAVNAEFPPSPAGGTYLVDDQGTSLELLYCPREFDADFGFVPVASFGRPALWPQPGSEPAAEA